MSLEAVQKVAEVEQKNKERRTAAEAEAKRLISEAERSGQALLKQTRTQEAEEAKVLLQQAEDRAKARSAEILKSAEAEGDALRNTAAAHLTEAAALIVGKVVNR